MDNPTSKIPRILSADDLANFRYLIKKYGIEPTNLSITGNISSGGLITATSGFKVGSSAGIGASVTLAKLTGGGATGTLTIDNGIVTGYVAPT